MPTRPQDRQHRENERAEDKAEAKEEEKDKGKVRTKVKEKGRTKENNPTLTIPRKKETRAAEASATRTRVTAHVTMKVVLMSISLRTESTVPSVAAAISGIRLAIVLVPVSRGVGKDAEKREKERRKAIITDLQRQYLWKHRFNS